MYANLIGLKRRVSARSSPSKVSLSQQMSSDATSRLDAVSITVDDYDKESYDEVSLGNGNAPTSASSSSAAKTSSRQRCAMLLAAADADLDEEEDERGDAVVAAVDGDLPAARRDETSIGSSDEQFVLISEIKAAYMDDDGESNNKANTNNNNNNNNRYPREEEEDEEDADTRADDMINLNELKISIDDIEELVDKSNKACYVFVIKVWDERQHQQQQQQQTEARPETASVSPDWSVKRKYDEFYVLDSRLREFHEGLFANSGATSGATISGAGSSSSISSLSGGNHFATTSEKIFAHLPAKQRALFFLNNSRNIEYLSSIKSDFVKYLQVAGHSKSENIFY